MSLATLALEVHAADKARARSLIRSALQEAGDHWIPVNAIAEVMVDELAALARGAADREQISAYLRHVADVLDAAGPYRLSS